MKSYLVSNSGDSFSHIQLPIQNLLKLTKSAPLGVVIPVKKCSGT